MVRKRGTAPKTLELQPCDDKEKDLAKTIVEAATEGSLLNSGRAVLVFARRLDDVTKINDGIEKAIKADWKEAGDEAPAGRKPSNQIAMLTGTMRGYERDRLPTNPIFQRFLPEGDRVIGEGVEPLAEGTVYLICTAAGEVGVNLSADDMVSDLSTFEAMAQRLGRVNRFGIRNDSRVIVVHPESFDTEKGDRAKIEAAREKTLDLLQKLVRDHSGDASPAALDKLDEAARAAAFSPEPRIPCTSDILFDAWALTSIKGTLPGRPEVAPFLHGIADWEPPRTSVAWRDEVAVITDEIIDNEGSDFPESLLADYPLKPHELLNDRSDRLVKALQARIEAELKRQYDRQSEERPGWRPIGVPLWVLVGRDRVVRCWITKPDEDIESSKGVATLVHRRESAERELERERIELTDATILLPPWLGGLSDTGMFDAKSTSSVSDVADEWLGEDERPRRRRLWTDDTSSINAPARMARIRPNIDTKPHADALSSNGITDDVGDESDTNEELVAEQVGDETVAESWSQRRQRYWVWYSRPTDAENATRASPEAVAWPAHTNDVVQNAEGIASRLGSLPAELREALALAAEWHDLGKQRELWQRVIGRPATDESWYEKSGRGWRGNSRLSRYRHEFGSVLDVLQAAPATEEHRARWDALPADDDPMLRRDLVLHLIAAHHGNARPHFAPEQTVDPKHSQAAAKEAAHEGMRRFARLQHRYGRWGLAYLESLLRAADHAASAGWEINASVPTEAAR